MDFRDNSFDICLDKGTYDALAVRVYDLISLFSAVRRVKGYSKNWSKRC